MLSLDHQSLIFHEIGTRRILPSDGYIKTVEINAFVAPNTIDCIVLNACFPQ